jgi:hypothetical protein
MVPWNDFPPGGGYAPGRGGIASPIFTFPFYRDYENSSPQGYNLQDEKVGANELDVNDAPNDPCLFGGLGVGTPFCNNGSEPVGAYGGYFTHLAGVLPGFQAGTDCLRVGGCIDLGVGVSWKSNYTGSTGGVYGLKAAAVGMTSDGNGAGGVSITSVQTATSYQYNGLAVTSLNGVPAPNFQVGLGIKPPATAPVPINVRAQGVIPVAVLSSNAFDATLVNATTVHFGPNAAQNVSPPTLQDVNGDGLPDLVLHFNQQDTGIACGNTSAVLNGKTITGSTFAGSEAIRTGC